MLPIITVLTVLQSLPDLGPGPLDAFRANYASIKVDVQYQYTFGPADSKVRDRFWRLEEPKYDESAGPDRWLLSKWGISKGEVNGSWSCDGASEHYHYASPDWMFKMAREHNGGRLPNPLVDIFPDREGVFDGSTWVAYQVLPNNDGRIVRPRGLSLHDPRVPAGMRLGPFVWRRAVYSFPQLLEIEAAGSKLTRRTAQRDGRPVEVEIYEYDPPAASRLSRIEISYDPAIGYLPRFARELYRSEDDEAHVVEMYLIKARPCAGGGFVPTEWYDTLFKVSGFSKRYPKYDDDTVLDPSEPFELGHFRVTDFKDRSTPIALNVKDIDGIYMPGGFASFPPGTNSLTMPQLKAFIHSKSSKASVSSLPNLGGDAARGPGGPTLDAEELKELKQFAEQPVPRWSWYLIVPLFVVLIASLVLWRRGSARVLSMVLLCWWASGCTQQVPPPVVKLSADFEPNHILFDNDAHFPSLKLMVRNTGDQPFQLRGVDGGCSCRKIDQSKLPTVLAPGKPLLLDVEFASNSQTSISNLAITFHTDRGPIRTPVSFLALPSHQIDPSTFSGSLQEGQEGDW